jgi:RNA polymerase sigma factor (sigma-70 family)
MTEPIEDLLRQCAPQVLGALVRRYRQFDACEDAVQEALLAASTQWPIDGIPENPRAWLITVAARRLTDHWRSEQARRRREESAVALLPSDEWHAPAADALQPEHDDTLQLLFLCCHPDLSPASQLALTLRAVGGLTTEQIARAFLVPETTMGQRISRAKQRIKTSNTPFRPGVGDEWSDRLGVVLHVLYLIFNEGYTATSGPELHRAELTHEAIRLSREVHRLLPQDGEVTGLLALMLLTDARRAARTTSDGALVPLAEQDRTRWDAAAIAEGIELITHSLQSAPLGPYQLQAAIAAVHAETTRAADTDWPQILALYRALDHLSPNPIVQLNAAIALAMVDGPRAGLDALHRLDSDDRLSGSHRLDAARAHLLDLAGDLDAAVTAYRRAARATTSLPEQRYLHARAARLMRAEVWTDGGGSQQSG